jgi:hypothetical protein
VPEGRWPEARRLEKSDISSSYFSPFLGFGISMRRKSDFYTS